MSFTFSPHAPRTAPGFGNQRSLWEKWHLDGPLLLLLFILMGIGCFVLFSAANQNLGMFERQLARFGIALAAMTFIAQIPPR